MAVGRDNELYAGGSFRLIDDASGYGLARWSYVGGGTNDAVPRLPSTPREGCSTLPVRFDPQVGGRQIAWDGGMAPRGQKPRT